MRTRSRSLGATLLVVATAGLVLSAHALTGPSSSASPYVVRTQPGVVSKSILTVGDSIDGYRLVGIPDGLGAFDNGDGTFTLLVNHEIRPPSGVPRAHGAAGAFVSRWIIRKGDLAVIHGDDLIEEVVTWNPALASWNVPAKGVVLSRFCSADLPPSSAFYDTDSGLGTRERIFMNGEEIEMEGRAFAHLMDGTSYELPGLGKAQWENMLAHPGTGASTVVVGIDDSSAGQVYVYVGTKTSSANPVDAAGLTNGVLFGIKIDGLTNETDASSIADDTPFSVHEFGDVSAMTGLQIDSASKASGVTGFQRPEDGAWDPSNPNDFYFVTTATFNGRSRLWRLRFANPAEPQRGGTVSMVLDGTEGQRMFDNVAITRHGQIVLQEDPGTSDPRHLAKIWRYSIATDTLDEVAHHDPARFIQGATGYLGTFDEESSGIIDASEILGDGWFLLDVQVPFISPSDTELVAGGQLLALHIPRGGA